MKYRAGVFALVAMACTGQTDADSAMCFTEPGFYKVTYAETSGSCGSFELVVELGETASLGPGCTGSRTWDAQTCTTNLDVSCEVQDAGRMLQAIVHTRGAVVWRYSDFASGVVEIEIEGYCRSVVNVTYQKIQ